MTETRELCSDDRVAYVCGAEAEKVLDTAAQHYLGISGVEFLRRYDAGEYGSMEHCSDPRLVYLMMLLPFGPDRD